MSDTTHLTVGQIPLRVADRVSRQNAFLMFNECEILTNASTVGHEVVKRLADEHYGDFRVRQAQTFESNFEKESVRSAGRKRHDGEAL